MTSLMRELNDTSVLGRWSKHVKSTAMKHLTAATVMALLVSGPLFAANASDTPADTLHPNIHDKVGNGPGANSNANPNGNNGQGSNGGAIHGIGNVPGQSGTDPSDGEPGFADQLETVHGGIGAKNKNAADDGRVEIEG